MTAANGLCNVFMMRCSVLYRKWVIIRTAVLSCATLPHRTCSDCAPDCTRRPVACLFCIVFVWLVGFIFPFLLLWVIVCFVLAVLMLGNNSKNCRCRCNRTKHNTKIHNSYWDSEIYKCHQDVIVGIGNQS